VVEEKSAHIDLVANKLKPLRDREVHVRGLRRNWAKTFDDKQPFPPLNMRVIHLKDAVRYQSAKSGGKQCTTEEYGNAEAKLSSGIE
jgi:hypothetical protein